MQNNKIKIIVMVFPAIAIILSILGLSLYTGISQSLGYFPEIGMNEVTLKFYKKIISSQTMITSLKFTFNYSILSALISIILGVVIALIIKKNNDVLVEKLMNIPIIVPHMIFSLIVLQLLSQTGLVSRVLFNVGVLERQESFPLLLFSKNSIGIILCYLIKEIPFVALTILSVLRRIDEKYYEQAASLGANKYKIFSKITFPLILPNIFYVFIIIFIYAFGDYEVAQLLGPTSPKSLATLSYNAYTNPLLEERPEAMAYNMIIFSFGILATIIMIAVFRKMIKVDENYE